MSGAARVNLERHRCRVPFGLHMRGNGKLGVHNCRLQGETSTLMLNPTLWHAQFRRQPPISSQLQRSELAASLNAP
jgi:hypothetical protein